MDKTNLFFHAPKELVTDAFLTWLFYYLDSKKEFENFKNIFFSDLFLKPEDKNQKIYNIKVENQKKILKGRCDIIVSFNLGNQGEKKILFENKTWGKVSKKQLNKYKEAGDLTNCYRYILLKLAYINSQEKEIAEECGYDIIDSDMLCNALSKIQEIHPYIHDYYHYLKETFCDFIKSFRERIFDKNDVTVLRHAQAQHFFIDEIYVRLKEKFKRENLSDNELVIKAGNNLGGNPWTQLNICEMKSVYDDISETIFWRIDKKEKMYYLRLNQYANIDSEGNLVRYKIARREKLRKIASDIASEYKDLKPGKLSNRGKKESELLILFLKENRLDQLINIIPEFSEKFHNKYKQVSEYFS